MRREGEKGGREGREAPHPKMAVCNVLNLLCFPSTLPVPVFLIGALLVAKRSVTISSPLTHSSISVILHKQSTG